MLEVGDGHRVYWETCGAPDGKPAVCLHGGPGSGSAPWWRRLFDPQAYRVVLFDQRGSGRSVPHAELRANTTHHLVADIEALRSHLEIDRWLVLGGSWGSVLAQAYAQRHRERVTELVLFAVAAGTRREVDWITRDVGRYFPAEWERFSALVPAGERPVDAYHRLLVDPDPRVHEPAAREWCAWEDRHMRTHADEPPDPRFDDAAFRRCFARLVTHYWRHDAWLEDGELLDNASRLNGIPGVLIHGRLDLSSPIDSPWRLAQAWETSELVVIDDAGHKAQASMIAAIVAATDRFARCRSAGRIR